MNVLKIGIVGFGGAGLAHSVYYKSIPGCNVAKIFDLKAPGRERARAACPSAVICDGLEEFWKGLDAVSICTPDSTHASYVAAALENGLHVLCEKPLTDSPEGIRAIMSAKQRSKRVVAVLHQMRFVPVHRRMKSLLDQKRLGAVAYFEGYYVHNLVHRAFAYDQWRFDDKAAPLLYAGCHFFDLLRWLADDDILEVYAAANHLLFPDYPDSDLGVATLRFSKGAIGKVLVAFGASSPQDHSVRIYGNKGSIENNLYFDDKQMLRVIHEPRLIDVSTLDRSGPFALAKDVLAQFRGSIGPYLIGKSFCLSRTLMRRRDGEYHVRFYPLRLYEHRSACTAAIRDFVDAIRSGRPPLCTAEESAKTVLACLAGAESIKTNRPVQVARLEDVVS